MKKTIEKCYGSFVSLFPSKIGRWLWKNRIGGIIGGIYCFVGYFHLLACKGLIAGGLPAPIITISYLLIPLFLPWLYFFRFIGGFISLFWKGGIPIPFSLIPVFLLGIPAGAFIQSLLRRIFRGRW